MVNLWLIMVNLWIIYDPIWVNFIRTEPCSPEPWEWWLVIKGNYPNMVELFRLVKYIKIYPDPMIFPSSHQTPLGNHVFFLVGGVFIHMWDHRMGELNIGGMGFYPSYVWVASCNLVLANQSWSWIPSFCAGSDAHYWHPTAINSGTELDTVIVTLLPSL